MGSKFLKQELTCQVCLLLAQVLHLFRALMGAELSHVTHRGLSEHLRELCLVKLEKGSARLPVCMQSPLLRYVQYFERALVIPYSLPLRLRKKHHAKSRQYG